MTKDEIVKGLRSTLFDGDLYTEAATLIERQAKELADLNKEIEGLRKSLKWIGEDEVATRKRQIAALQEKERE